MTTVARTGTGTTPLAKEKSRERTGVLADALLALRSRRSKISAEGVFLTVGTLLLPAGILTIVLGWYGAAHTGYLYEQNDYLISGGLVGLGLVVVGAVLCIGYWMTRQTQATESGSRQVLQALAGLEERTGRSAQHTPEDASAAVFVATPNGTMRHRPECPTVAGQTVRILVGSESAAYRPCAICTDREELP